MGENRLIKYTKFKTLRNEYPKIIPCIIYRGDINSNYDLT